MDIQVASNFERYLYFLYDEDAGRTREAMTHFAQSGSLHFSEIEQQKDQGGLPVGKRQPAADPGHYPRFLPGNGYVLDPHTAVGVSAGLDHLDPDVPMVCLATAHPAKFGAAVQQAIGRPPEMPESFRDLDKKESRCRVLDADLAQIKAFIEENAI